ncbi:MAG: creatininase family protein [Promethearchaeota archaeon]
MNEKVLYIELTPQEFKERLAKAPIAYLPLGTLEWHGKHMPLGADGLISSGFFIELAQKVGGIVLPMLFLGPDNSKTIDGKEYYGMDIQSFPSHHPQQLLGSAYWVKKSLFKQIIAEILKQLKRAGFKIVVAHGHDPSTMTFYQSSKKWREEFDLELFTCWRNNESDGLGIQIDHAAANETSLMMGLRPELVKIENLSKDMNEKPLGLDGKDPREFASPEEGKKIISLQVERMAEILNKALQKVSLNSH